MKDVKEYIENLDAEKRQNFKKLYLTVKAHLPQGFAEVFDYGMPGFAVPKSRYPAGYHVAPHNPLPFISMAQQKGGISFYHLGLYSFPSINEWFREEYKKKCGTAPDMGKACLRLKPSREIPFDLIGELCSKIGPDDWIKAYEESRDSGRKK